MIGALDIRSGELLWRHDFGAAESVEAIAVEGRLMASVSGGGRYLRVWTAAEGFLLWDAPTGAAAGLDKADVWFVPDVDDDEHEDVAVAVGSSVAVFSGVKGKRLWLWQADDTRLQLSKIVHADASAGSIKVVGSRSGGAQIDTIVDIGSKLGSSKKGARALGRSCPSVGVMAASIVCVEGSTLYTWALDDMSSTYHSLDSLASGSPVDAAAAHLDTRTGKDVALVHLSADACVAVRVSRDKAAAVAKLTAPRHHQPPGYDGARFVAALGADKNGNEAAVSVAPAADGGLELTLVTLKDKTEKKERYAPGAWSVDEQGGLAALWAQPYVRKEGSTGVRAMVKSTSSTLTLLQQDKVVWSRTEALAYVEQAVLVDIPVPAPGHNELMDDDYIASMSPVTRLFKRTATDLADLVHFVSNPPKVMSSTREQASWDSVGVSLKHDLTPDRFGFKKIIVVITSRGVVAGIHSDTGDIVWQRYYADAQLERVFLTRGSAADGQFECVVLGRATGGDKSQSLAIFLQPLTGSELRPLQRLPFHLVQAAMAPLLTKSHAQVVVGMDTERRVHVFPDTAEAWALVAGKSGKIFFYITEVGSSTMTGYVMLAGKGSRELMAEEAWTVALPSGEAITALAPHNAQEAVRSAGRVLGNRAVLLKYLNVNSLAVATESVGGQEDLKEVSSAPTVGAKEPCVRIYLIDTVSGAIIHSVVHKEARGPVQLVQTEHTLVYTYWNTKKERTEMTVMDLFENSKQEILTAGQMMMYNDSKTTYSSHGMQTDKPRVLTQTYIMPIGVKNLAVTQSVHGITTRNILVSLANDRVLSLDRKFLDPRRPLGKPTPDDMEEMLVPYSPFMPIVPTAILSYNQTVHQLRDFAVAPARIESTSLMLAFGLSSPRREREGDARARVCVGALPTCKWRGKGKPLTSRVPGVDLFFTRVSPAKTFDCLGEDFNYPTLILAILGLAALAGIANWYANKSELEKAWK